MCNRAARLNGASEAMIVLSMYKAPPEIMPRLGIPRNLHHGDSEFFSRAFLVDHIRLLYECKSTVDWADRSIHTSYMIIRDSENPPSPLSPGS